MNNTTDTNAQEVTISGRHFVAQGPTPSGCYTLVSDKGTPYIACQAYIGDESLLKVIGGKGAIRELYINGNRSMLRADEAGRLVQVAW